MGSAKRERTRTPDPGPTTGRTRWAPPPPGSEPRQDPAVIVPIGEHLCHLWMVLGLEDEDAG